jgi:hypothetical protein
MFSQQEFHIKKPKKVRFTLPKPNKNNPFANLPATPSVNVPTAPIPIPGASRKPVRKAKQPPTAIIAIDALTTALEGISL